MTKANYGVECSHCGAPIALLEDVGDAVVNIPRPGRLRLKCRSCGHRDRYTTDRVQRYEVVAQSGAVINSSSLSRGPGSRSTQR